MHGKLLQSCLTLCDAMGSLGSSVHGIHQARIPEWVAMFSSRGSLQPRYQTYVFYVSCIGRWVLYHQHHLERPRIIEYLYVKSDYYAQSLSCVQLLRPHRQLTRLLCPWDSPGKNTGVGCHALQGIFATQGLNPCLLVSYTGRRFLYHQRHLGNILTDI